MSYFLKKSIPSKKGLYLQIYRTNYVPGKGNKNKSYQAIGYVSDLKAQGIEDPIKYALKLVKELNEKNPSPRVKQVGENSVTKNLGYFLIKAVIDGLDVDQIMNTFTQQKHFKFKMSEFVRAMIYAQIANPGSKLKAYEKVIPNLYGVQTFSYDQILDGIEYIGQDYTKYIELFNQQINELWGRQTDVNFFDCTNYYFEIDLEDDMRRKGPSKENRRCPIIGQALLLDKEQIPLGMLMYPGNQSEKPYLRKMIEDTKTRYDIKGRVIQVADKGLNCAKNIYSAVKEANDGYIFSKSVHGRCIPDAERKWVLLKNDVNPWVDVKDSNGNIAYRYKECIDVFEYKFLDNNGEEVKFKVKEKRIATYNPSLAAKQKMEITNEVNKAINGITIKELSKEEFGNMSKYVNFTATTKGGEKAKIASSLNQEKINEDLAMAGYNLLVTSETNMPAQEIYAVYHGLWKIEESFKIMKSYLDARPVFLQKEESIVGHFTICYLALTILRLLEIKIFKNRISTQNIIEFIRQYSITDTGEKCFINNSTKGRISDIICEELGLAKLGNLLLKQRDVDLILETEI
jgi:transposase DDE domain